MSVATTVRAVPPRRHHLRRFLRTPKGYLLLAFVSLLPVSVLAAGWRLATPHVTIAVLVACLTEVVLVWAIYDASVTPTSALLSGLIIAFILAPNTPWPITAWTAAFAIFSKHLLRLGRNHIFNPAALALLVSAWLFATGHSWWGALTGLPWPWLALLVIGGAFNADLINKFPLVLTFLGTYFGVSTLVSLGDPARAAEMFRDPFLNAALFFALYMLTDPPSSPSRYRDQIVMGALTAVVAGASQLAGVGQTYLLVACLSTNVLLAAQRWWYSAQVRRGLARRARSLAQT